MYPANVYGSEFFWADLPDTLVYEDETLTKVNEPNFTARFVFNYGNIDEYIETLSITRLYAGPERLVGLYLNKWIFCIDGDPYFIVLQYNLPCLFSIFPLTSPAQDQFDPVYHVESFDNVFNNPAYFTQNVVRNSLCSWVGSGTNLQESEATLSYVSATSNLAEAYPSAVNKWMLVLGESGNFAVKEGHQNTPVGTYNNPSGVAIVSEL